MTGEVTISKDEYRSIRFVSVGNYVSVLRTVANYLEKAEEDDTEDQYPVRIIVDEYDGVTSIELHYEDIR